MRDIFKWEYVWYFFPRILQALPVTLTIVVVATIIGTLIGMVIALVRIEKIPVLSQIFTVMVSFLRGTPIYVQLFIVYFGVPMLLSAVGIVGFAFDRMLAVYIAYGLNVGAFFSETFRSAIQSVPKDQKEAAYSVGLTKSDTYKRIILPQAVRIAAPNYGATIVALLQDTSIAFTIGIIEVIGKIKIVSSSTYRSLEGYFVAGIIFVILSIILQKIFDYIDYKSSFKTARKAKKTQQAI